MHLKLQVKCIHFVNQTGHQLSVGELCIFVWAGRYIECDDHAHLVSKAGSVVSGKSNLSLPAFRWSSI